MTGFARHSPSNELPSTHHTLPRPECIHRQRLGESISLLFGRFDVFDDDSVTEMLTKPVMLDCDVFGSRSHARRICSRQNATGAIVFEDSTDRRKLVCHSKLEVFVQFKENGSKLNEFSHCCGKCDVLSFHGGHCDLGLNH